MLLGGCRCHHSSCGRSQPLCDNIRTQQSQSSKLHEGLIGMNPALIITTNDLDVPESVGDIA